MAKPAPYKVTADHPVSLPNGLTGAPGDFVDLLEVDAAPLVTDGHLTPATLTPDTAAESVTSKEK